MPREDIRVNVQTGEPEISENLTNKTFHPFALLERVEGKDNDTYLFGEVYLPENFWQIYRAENGLRVHIPYSAIYKRLQVRFRSDALNGATTYRINKKTNQVWFAILIPESKTTESRMIHLSEYPSINAACTYNLIVKDDHAVLYSASESDFNIYYAKEQNEVFMLKASASNLYQYPTTGVGLLDFLHGNFENSGLAQKLQQEFEQDKMIIKNAFMDSQTGELLLEVEERNG